MSTGSSTTAPSTDDGWDAENDEKCAWIESWGGGKVRGRGRAIRVRREVIRSDA
jgi:hypothetical protein